MTIIRNDDYFEPGNNLLSGSKIKDYIKDKEFFYKKHIAGEIETPITDALIIGSAVDCWLSEGRKIFDEKYIVFGKGTKRNKAHPDFKHHLTETIYNQIVAMCTKAEKQPAFHDLADYEKQIILKAKMNLGVHFKYLSGIPDWFKVDGDTCIIVDLKTAQSASNFKYHYHCLEFGYYFQQAVYQYLLKKLNPGIEKFVSKHWVIEKDRDDIYNSYTFNLSQARIDKEKEKLEIILDDIKKEKDFTPRVTSWEDAESIGLLEEEMDAEMDL